MLSEREIIDRILLAHPHMFRNAAGWGIAASPKQAHRTTSGGWLIDHGSPVKFGLFPGSSDTIGWNTVTITPDMVGKKLAVFQSIEVKTEHDRLSKEQRIWNRVVQQAGGIVEVWHDDGTGRIEIIKGDRII